MDNNKHPLEKINQKLTELLHLADNLKEIAKEEDSEERIQIAQEEIAYLLAQIEKLEKDEKKKPPLNEKMKKQLIKEIHKKMDAFEKANESFIKGFKRLKELVELETERDSTK